MKVELAFIVLCAIIMYYYWFFYMDYKAYYTIPKKVWTYLPPSRDTNPSTEKARRLGIETWRKHHPDMEIIVLTDENYQGYLMLPSTLFEHPLLKETPERRRRLLQFTALIEHGGIWMDPTILANKDLKTWIFPKHARMVSFYKHVVSIDKPPKEKGGNPEKEECPSIEMSCLAVSRNHPFVHAWKQEWLKLLEYPCAEDYVEARRSWKVPMDHIKDPIENTTEVALQTLYQFYPPSRDTVLFRPIKEAYTNGLEWLTEEQQKNKAYQLIRLP